LNCNCKSDRMREIFDPCVNQILDLIDDQITEVTSRSAAVKVRFTHTIVNIAC
jgi:hypothetical protein